MKSDDREPGHELDAWIAAHPDPAGDAAFDARFAEGLVHADVDDVAARRIRAAALVAMATGPRFAARRWLESAAVAAMASSYVVWAFHAVLATYR